MSHDRSLHKYYQLIFNKLFSIRRIFYLQLNDEFILLCGIMFKNYFSNRTYL